MTRSVIAKLPSRLSFCAISLAAMVIYNFWLAKMLRHISSYLAYFLQLPVCLTVRLTQQSLGKLVGGKEGSAY